MKNLIVMVVVIVIALVCIVGVNNVYFGSEYVITKVNDKLAESVPISLQLDKYKSALKNMGDETDEVHKQLVLNRIAIKRTKAKISDYKRSLQNLLENILILRASLADPCKTMHYGHTRQQVESDLEYKAKQVNTLVRKIDTGKNKLLQFGKVESSYNSMISEYKLRKEDALARISELALRHDELKLAAAFREPNEISDTRLAYVTDGLNEIEVLLEKIEVEAEVKENDIGHIGITPETSASYTDLDLDQIVAKGESVL